MTILRNRLLERVIAPVCEPLTLKETKLYLRVDHNDEDMLISDLIVAARMSAEHWLKRSLITQSWMIAYDRCAPQEIVLPMGPIDSVTSVQTIARDGTVESIDQSLYFLNASKTRLCIDTAIAGFKIEIVYVAGYGEASAIPHPIKQGMLSHIAGLYDNRGEAINYGLLPQQTEHLYMPFRQVAL